MSRAASALLAILLVGGCRVPRGAGFDDVQRLAADHGAPRIHWNQGTDEDRQVAQAIDRLLKQPLTPQSSVEIALLNNPRLQATYERLGVAQADLVQAGLLRNPSFSLGVGFPIGRTGVEWEGGLVEDFLDAFLIPLKKRLARADFAAVKLEVADRVLAMIAETRSAFFAVQAGQQVVAMRQVVLDAAEAAAELATRQHAAGNVSDLDLASERAMTAQARIEMAHAQARLLADREHLSRTLGVSVPTAWKIDAPLAAIPERELPLDGLESFALAHRLDLAVARQRLLPLRAAISIARAGIFGGLELGVQLHQDPDAAAPVLGPSLRFEIPIFDQHQGTIARLQAELRRGQEGIRALSIDIRSEVREAHDRLRTDRGVIDYYRSTVLPLRERIVALSEEQYNAMLIGVFQLLTAKQDQANAWREYIEDVRDYWIARAELERVAGAPLPDRPHSEGAMK